MSTRRTSSGSTCTPESQDSTLACARSKAAGLTVLSLSVMPNAKRTEVAGLHDGGLRIRLAAPPVDGKANETLIAWVADQLRVPKRAVRLLRGQTSRQKQLEIDLAVADVQRWLALCLSAVDRD